MPRGIAVELVFRYNNHTFSRIPNPKRPATGADPGYVGDGESPSLAVEYFTPQLPTNDLDYEDISTVNVTIELAGGNCNRTLGPAEVWFTRQPECGPIFRLVRNITRFSNIVSLPAHRFDFTFGILKTALPTFNLAVRDYFIRVNNFTGEFDLVNISDTTVVNRTRFEYHPLPTLTVSFSDVEPQTCANGSKPLVLESLLETTAKITVVEIFTDPKITQCTDVTGQLVISNQLGEDIEEVELLSICREACTQDIIRDRRVRKNGSPVCAINVSDNTTATLSCPNNGTITEISFAQYGSRMTTGSCPSGFTNSACRANESYAVSNKECVGKQSCSIEVSASKFFDDSCPNTEKYFTIRALCSFDTFYYENARVELPMQVGYPSRISPYIKPFAVSMDVPGYIKGIAFVCLWP